MFGSRWRLCHLLGIPISVDASWLIILALLTLSLSNGYPSTVHEFFPGTLHQLAAYDYWIMGLATALGFFACILLHELGHAVVARAQGMPIRGITLFLFGGVAEIEGEPRSASNEFFMAIAGPVVSLVLGVLFCAMALTGRAALPLPIAVVLGYLGVLNLVVLAFNLIPAFPLDGGRVLRSIFWGATGNLKKSTRWAAFIGQLFAWLLIARGIVFFFGGDWLNGIWMGLIGIFLNNAAKTGYQQVLIRQALQNEPVRQFMNPEPISVPPTITVLQWVEDYVYRFHRKTFPVIADGRLVGCITTRALAELPRSEWERRTVEDLMLRDLAPLTIAPDTDALDALTQMQRNQVSRLLVTQDGHLVGIVSLKDLLRFLNLKLELHQNDDERI
jgi:Zn-dependent protease/CBS domain-containing protein